MLQNLKGKYLLPLAMLKILHAVQKGLIKVGRVLLAVPLYCIRIQSRDNYSLFAKPITQGREQIQCNERQRNSRSNSKVKTNELFKKTKNNHDPGQSTLHTHKNTFRQRLSIRDCLSAVYLPCSTQVYFNHHV